MKALYALAIVLAASALSLPVVASAQRLGSPGSSYPDPRIKNPKSLTYSAPMAHSPGFARGALLSHRPPPPHGRHHGRSF